MAGENYTGNYTSSPNSDVLQLLTTINEAARDRANRLALSGGGGGAYIQESGPNIDDMVRALGNATDHHTRTIAMQSIVDKLEKDDDLRRRLIEAQYSGQLQSALGSQGAQQASQLSSQQAAQTRQLSAQESQQEAQRAQLEQRLMRETLDHYAKTQMFLAERERMIRGQLESAEGPEQADLANQLADIQKKTNENQLALIAAQAAQEHSPDSMKALLGGLAQQTEMKTALSKVKEHAGKFDVGGMLPQWNSDSSGGGSPTQDTTRSALTALQQGLAKGVGEATSYLFGDNVADVEISQFVGGGSIHPHSTTWNDIAAERGIPEPLTAKEWFRVAGNPNDPAYTRMANKEQLQMMAAAVGEPEFGKATETYMGGPGNSWLHRMVQSGGTPEAQAAAQQYHSRFLTRYLTDGLTMAGVPNAGNAKDAVNGLVRELMSVQGSTTLTNKERDERVLAALNKYSPEIFGSNSGPHQVGQLYEALDTLFENAAKAAPGVKANAFAPGKLNVAVLQSGANAAALRQADGLRSVLRNAAKTGGIINVESLTGALGLAEQAAKDPFAALAGIEDPAASSKELRTLLAVAPELKGRFQAAKKERTEKAAEVSRLQQEKVGLDTEAARTLDLKTQRAAKLRALRSANIGADQMLRLMLSDPDLMKTYGTAGLPPLTGGSDLFLLNNPK